MDSVAGRFEIDWSKENLEAVNRTILKKYNAEIHSQSAIECMLAIRTVDKVKAEDVDSINVHIFDVAYKIIGGGEEGEKKLVRTKEEADHSLPYILSAALIDGEVSPEQYRPQRITQSDVQALLRKVQVYPSEEFSNRFPDAMPCEITIHLRSGQTVTRAVEDYEGFLTRPMNLAQATEKFTKLTSKFIDEDRQKRIIDAVTQLEHIKTRQMMELLNFNLANLDNCHIALSMIV